MEKSYEINGMTCMGCVNSVSTRLKKLSNIQSFNVQLESPQLSVNSSSEIPFETLDNAIGKYTLSKIKSSYSTNKTKEITINNYKPLILIVAFLILVTVLAQFPFSAFSFKLWMRHFMAGFFLSFSFFKFLDLKGFVESFEMYDILAKKWKSWGYIFPVMELLLGISYFTNFNPMVTNISTIVLLGLTSIGVIQSILRKQHIKCACLGAVFDLPMTKVTIFENAIMIIMALIMILS